MSLQDLYNATINHYLAPVMPYMEDPGVSEVMINGPDEIFVERDGQMIRTDARFADRETYEAAVNNILHFTGKSFSDTQPLVDTRLPDGSRVHVAKPPCARHGTVVNIRKFTKETLDIDWLVQLGTLTGEAKAFLELAVLAEQNMLVCGGTSSGKTSLLNALSRCIPPTQRIVVIEDSAELQLQQEHVISLEARLPDRYGRGAVTIRDLFRASLRLRPDRIIIGEVRGGEALDMIQAMTSGHGGSMGTMHAESPGDALHRIETMAMMSGVELPLHALRAQCASAIDLIVQMHRQTDGQRRVTQICEVEPLTEDATGSAVARIHSLFDLQPGEQGEMALRWTGRTPQVAEHLKHDRSITIPESLRKMFQEADAAEVEE